MNIFVLETLMTFWNFQYFYSFLINHFVDEYDKKIFKQKFICTQCGKRYKYARDCYMHEKICGIEPAFKCPHDGCKYMGKTKKLLKSHLLHKHLQFSWVVYVFLNIDVTRIDLFYLKIF